MARKPGSVLNRVKSADYRIRRPGHYKKFTTYVHEAVLPDFKRAAQILGYKLWEAETEALELWLEMKSDELKKVLRE